MTRQQIAAYVAQCNHAHAIAQKTGTPYVKPERPDANQLEPLENVARTSKREDHTMKREERTESVEITIYAQYGVLGHEKHPVYAFARSAICDEVTVEIPGELIIGCSAYYDLLLRLGGMVYPLSKALTNAGDRPALRWYNPRSGRYYTRPLKEMYRIQL